MLCLNHNFLILFEFSYFLSLLNNLDVVITCMSNGLLSKTKTYGNFLSMVCREIEIGREGGLRRIFIYSLSDYYIGTELSEAVLWRKPPNSIQHVKSQLNFLKEQSVALRS